MSTRMERATSGEGEYLSDKNVRLTIFVAEF